MCRCDICIKQETKIAMYHNIEKLHHNNDNIYHYDYHLIPIIAQH